MSLRDKPRKCPCLSIFVFRDKVEKCPENVPRDRDRDKVYIYIYKFVCPSGHGGTEEQGL